MIAFEIWYNSVENSCKVFYVKENEIHDYIFNLVAYKFEQSTEHAINAADWAELATDYEAWCNNDITIVCHTNW